MSKKKKYTTPTYLGQSVYVTPTYVVTKAEYDTPRGNKTFKQLENEKNLKDNKHNGKLSDKAHTRLKNAVNWLVASAQYKRVYSKLSKKHFWFKVNFITLTVPSQSGEQASEDTIKKMLHNFLVYSRKYFYLKNYIWKFEAHQDGRLHIHLTTDTFIHYKRLRKCWNGLLQKENLLTDYGEKYRGISLADYIKMQNPKYKVSDLEYTKRWNEGNNNNWNDPNTTDVHAVWKVSNIAAYISKYMSKETDLCRDYKGRIWGCNYELGDKNKCSVFIESPDTGVQMRWLANKQIEYAKIESPENSMGQRLHLGEIYYMSEKIWSGLANGIIKEAYNNRRYEIRHNISKPPPEYYILD